MKGYKGEGVANVRAHVLIEGRVQGVCFRAYTRDEARKRKVAGWVKNRVDGSVEAILEGEKTAVEAVIDWCRLGPPQARVTQVEVKWESYTGAFSDFSVGY